MICINYESFCTTSYVFNLLNVTGTVFVNDNSDSKNITTVKSNHVLFISGSKVEHMESTCWYL
jgi:hypothetical protein